MRSLQASPPSLCQPQWRSSCGKLSSAFDCRKSGLDEGRSDPNLFVRRPSYVTLLLASLAALLSTESRAAFSLEGVGKSTQGSTGGSLEALRRCDLFNQARVVIADIELIHARRQNPFLAHSRQPPSAPFKFTPSAIVLSIRRIGRTLCAKL